MSAIPSSAPDAGSPLDRLAARALPQPLLLIDVMQSRVIAANPQALALAGTDEATLRAQPLSHWLLDSPGPDDRRPLPGPMSGASARWRRHDGRLVDVVVRRGEVQPDDTGRVVQLLLLDERPAQAPGDDLLQVLLESLHDGVLVYDDQLRILRTNRAAIEILGLDGEGRGVPGHSSDQLRWDQVHEDGSPLQLHERPVWQALHAQERVHARIIGVDAQGAGGGKRRWLSVNASPVMLAAPHVGRGVVASFADITEQVKALRALRESEQLFRLFSDHTQDVVWIHAPARRAYLFVSPAIETLYGVTAADMYEDHDRWLERVHPEDRDRVRRQFRAQAVADAYQAEYRVVRPDGSERWVRDRGFPIRGAGGEVSYVAGLVEDITARREAERLRDEQRAAEQQLARLVATSPGVLFSYRMEPDGRVSAHVPNVKVREIYLGRRSVAQDLIRGDIRDVVHPDDRPRLRDSLQASAESLHAWREEFRVRHPERGELWIEAHALPVREPDGATQWSGFLHDVTVRKRAHEDMLRLNAELEQRVAERTAELQAKNREMESFTYSVSHDLKAPLRGIDGYSRLLQSDHADRLDEEGRHFVDTIRRATAQMGQLIDDLLTYSRIERGRPTLGPVDPVAVAESLLRERATDLEGVTLVRELTPLRAVGDINGLGLVLRNLIDNAIKFTHATPERRITLRCAEEGGRCRLSVQDNGPGFDMRYHDRIFEIFQRLHRAEDFPGTGVGLAIVRKAMERMNGRVWAQSAPGQGATFFVELPLAPPLPPAPPRPGTPSAFPSSTAAPRTTP